MENKEKALLDEELEDFFKDDFQPENEKKEEKIENVLKDLDDIFNVNKNDVDGILSIKDLKELLMMIDTVKRNLASIEAVYGEDVADKLKEVIALEQDILKQMEEFFTNRDEYLKRHNMLNEMTMSPDVPKDIKNMFRAFLAAHPEVDSVFLYYAIYNMIQRRMESESNRGSGRENGDDDKDITLGEVVAGVAGFKAGNKMAEIITNADKGIYLQNFFNKVKLIESATGIKLDNEFIKFFTSDEYIMGSDLSLPPMLQDENFGKLQDTWSLPVIVDDLRVEKADKELYAAQDSVNSLENYYAKNFGSTADNSAIEVLKGLSNDVSEEKNRVLADIEFFKKEKLKERVEVAILASVSGLYQNPKIDTLANLLKESITSRINYMKDEENLRDIRKQSIKDMKTKDNEKHHDEYFDALQNVNVAINKRREQRAKDAISFKPKILRAKDKAKENEISGDEKAINDQGMFKGKQKVLTYVKKYNNNSEISS